MTYVVTVIIISKICKRCCMTAQLMNLIFLLFSSEFLIHQFIDVCATVEQYMVTVTIFLILKVHINKLKMHEGIKLLVL